MTTRTTAPASPASRTSWVDRIVIPDDISELDAEVRALRRERRVQRRRQRLRRLVGPGACDRAADAGRACCWSPASPGCWCCSSRAGPPPHRSTLGQRADRRPAPLPDVLRRLVRDGTPPQRAGLPARRCSRWPRSAATATPRCATRARAAHRHNVNFYLVDRTLPPLPPGLDRRGRDPAGGADRRDRRRSTAPRRTAGGCPAARCWCSSALTGTVAPRAARRRSPTTLDERAEPADPEGGGSQLS